ncbi:hypothetical protein RUM43_012170 [Polyplax serrata]|uniref:Uncharacterized protein n=1 Tax=Polyplax serrata TaxID=468196 RepID=A0AAN8P399_POLSC
MKKQVGSTRNSINQYFKCERKRKASGARQRRTIPDEYAFKREKIRVAHKERVAGGSSSKEKGFRESVEGQLSGISKVLKEFAIKMKKNKKKKKQRDQRRGRLNSNDRKYHKP